MEKRRRGLTIDQNKMIARREIEEYEGKGDAAAGEELFAPGYRLRFSGFPPVDRHGHETILAGFREAFPDLRIEVVEQIAAGDRVANHWHGGGTHRGAFQGIPPTGKTVNITGNNVMHIEKGAIRELWGQVDTVGLLSQLGVIPGPPSKKLPEPSPVASGEGGGADVIRRFVTKFNEGRLDVIADEYDEAYVLDFPGGPTGRGKDGARSATTEFRMAFPDLHFQTDDLFEERDRVAWRWTMTGTHRGALGPFAASGRAVTLLGISLLRVRGRRIVYDRVRADMAGLLTQIGAIPAPQ
jgi:predicted ester cyclase